MDYLGHVKILSLPARGTTLAHKYYPILARSVFWIQH